MRLIVAITGASGAIYGIRLLEALREVPDAEVHLVISNGGKLNISLETDWAVKDVEALAHEVHSDQNLAATIASAPGFHLSASNRRLAEIADPSTLQRAGAGMGALDLSTVMDPVFARAFVRLRARDGLYLEDPAGVTFVDKGLFRARIALPASAPVGRYRVDVLLFQEGQPITRRSRELVVEKVGLERVISSFARQSPWAYGMACMLIALAAGWAASAVFRRV